MGFSDPQGPRASRTLPYALPVALLLLAIFGPLPEVASSLTGVASVAIFNLIGIVGVRQRKARNGELECGPGYIEIKRAGTRNQRIHARDITGATTSRNHWVRVPEVARPAMAAC